MRWSVSLILQDVEVSPGGTKTRTTLYHEFFEAVNAHEAIGMAVSDKQRKNWPILTWSARQIIEPEPKEPQS